jgi:transcriptional regulator with XRE-family HTH domain
MGLSDFFGSPVGFFFIQISLEVTMNKSALKVERVKRGLTQKDLANQTKIPRFRISMYESGVLKLRDVELQRLREALKSDFSNPDF